MTPPSFRYRLEAAMIRLAFGLFAILPLDMASAAGGFIARSIGPRLRVTKQAARRFEQALPEIDAAARKLALRKMWDNLGRVFAEYPHLPHLPESRIDVIGYAHFAAAQESGRPVICFSGHLGNWEIAAIVAAWRGVKLTQIYRAPNNPLVEELLKTVRRSYGADIIPKGGTGSRRLISLMREGGVLAVLVDQKMNEGVRIPFLGRDAPTATGIAELALRYDAKLVPARIERLQGAHFRLTFFPPLDLPQSTDRAAGIVAVMTEVNAVLEDWIRDDPGQWFWLHRRWAKE